MDPAAAVDADADADAGTEGAAAAGAGATPPRTDDGAFRFLLEEESIGFIHVEQRALCTRTIGSCTEDFAAV